MLRQKKLIATEIEMIVSGAWLSIENEFVLLRMKNLNFCRTIIYIIRAVIARDLVMCTELNPVSQLLQEATILIFTRIYGIDTKVRRMQEKQNRLSIKCVDDLQE